MEKQDSFEHTASVGEVSRRSDVTAVGDRTNGLAVEYREAAEDADAEREAHEWIEANVDDALDDEP